METWTVRVTIKYGGEDHEYECESPYGDEDLCILMAMGLLYEADWCPRSGVVRATLESPTGDIIELFSREDS